MFHLQQFLMRGRRLFLGGHLATCSPTPTLAGVINCARFRKQTNVLGCFVECPLQQITFLETEDLSKTLAVKSRSLTGTFLCVANSPCFLPHSPSGSRSFASASFFGRKRSAANTRAQAKFSSSPIAPMQCAAWEVSGKGSPFRPTSCHTPRNKGRIRRPSANDQVVLAFEHRCKIGRASCRGTGWMSDD